MFDEGQYSNRMPATLASHTVKDFCHQYLLTLKDREGTLFENASQR